MQAMIAKSPVDHPATVTAGDLADCPDCRPTSLRVTFRDWESSSPSFGSELGVLALDPYSRMTHRTELIVGIGSGRS
jgi:hypothetical protein